MTRAKTVAPMAGPLNILIADDLELNLDLLEAQLEGSGHHVYSAMDGREALEIIGNQPIDLVISDALMPVMDGFQFCRTLKRDQALAGIPFIMYTATYTDAKDESLAREVGADLYLRKPVSTDQLIEAIRGLTRNGKKSAGNARSETAAIVDDDYKLYSQRLVVKLEKKLLELDVAVARQQAAEAALRRTNRALLMCSDCDQALHHIEDQPALLDKICSLITDVGGYQMAWIGIARFDAEKSVTPVAQSGYEDGYLEAIEIHWSDDSQSQGPTGTAIRTGKTAVCRDIHNDPKFEPWRERAVLRGYESSIALPLVTNGDSQPMGALNIYARDPDAFDGDEVILLEKLANNLAFGVHAIQLRDEKSRAETTLQESERKYRHLVELAVDGIFLSDADGNYIETNESGCRMFGYSKEEFLLLNVKDFLQEKDYEIYERGVDALKRGQPIMYILDIVRKDGSLLPVEFSAKQLPDGRLQCIARDISRRKQVENDLLKQIRRTEQILQSTLEGYLLIDGPGRFIDVNLAYCEMVGYSRDELLAMNLMDVNKSLTPADLAQLIKGMTASGHDQYETQHTRKDGTRIDLEISIVMMPVKDALEIAAFIRDITDRKRAARKLHMSFDQLRGLASHLQTISEEERTHVAREIHDVLGQDLAAMKLELAWVRKHLSPDQQDLIAKLSSLVDLVDSTSESVNKIVTDLRPGILDEMGLLAAVQWQAEEFQKRNGIACELSVTPAGLVLDPDVSTAIFRVIQESLTNVARHARASKVCIDMKLAAGELTLRISDDGEGMPDKAPTDRKSYGLIGMHERIRAFDGSLNIESERDRGTTISIAIPLTAGDH